MIEVNINTSGEIQTLLIPSDIGINLMELLKGAEYDSIEGTCGGMALCATCHVKVTNAIPSLSEPSNDELDMLETLPFVYHESRLACQIKLNEEIQQLNIEIIKN
jgi:ferredoxin-2, mitochondrial